jgi:hypothetical protein
MQSLKSVSGRKAGLGRRRGRLRREVMRRKIAGGSNARWREEVMRRRTSAEVMLALSRQEAKPTSSGSEAN